MTDTIIRFDHLGQVIVEKMKNGVKSIKFLDMPTFINCFAENIPVNTGILPMNCISYSQTRRGPATVCIAFPENKAKVVYEKTVYEDFPLPRFVFAFSVSNSRVQASYVTVIEDTKFIKPTTKIYQYPFSNVSNFRICTGVNQLPTCKSLHTLTSLPYYILSMPNNYDHFSQDKNQLELPMRSLFEHLKDKEPDYYYTDILLPESGRTLSDFISHVS